MSDFACRKSVSVSASLPASLATLALVAVMCGWSTPAEAARWRVRSYSLAEASQMPRSDGELAARRLFSQGLTLSAYDLLGDRSGSLNAFVDLRYTTDFGLSASMRQDPQFADDWNRAALRVGYLTWQPVDGVELRAGRQWSRGPLSVRDFDGLRLRLAPRLDATTRAHLVGWIGRDVQWTTADYNTDDFDVQGIPAEARRPGPFGARSGYTAGVRLGMNWERGGGIDLAWRRRWRPTEGLELPEEFRREAGPTIVGSERLGIAARAVPHRRFNVSASAAYHTLLETVDRARFDVAWRLPRMPATVTLGGEHRHPWFDASSIFNLFGARPHQGGFGTWRHRLAGLDTTLEGRGWMRIYHGAPGPTGIPLPTDAPDMQERRWGLAAAHRSRLTWLQRQWRWRSELSVETTSQGPGGDHFLADTHLRVPVLPDRLFAKARAVGLVATPDRASSLRPGRDELGWAASWLVGADVPLRELGTVGMVARTTHGSLRRRTISLYGTLNLEFWP